MLPRSNDELRLEGRSPERLTDEAGRDGGGQLEVIFLGPEQSLENPSSRRMHGFRTHERHVEAAGEPCTATLSFLGVPPRPPFSLRSMADRVQFENERSENEGLGA